MSALATFALFSSLVSATYAGSSSCDIGQWWYRAPGALSWVSSGSAGVWGVNSAQRIYYRDGTYVGAKSYNYSYNARNYGYSHSTGGEWTPLDGLLVQIDSGRDVVWGTNAGGDVYYRSGMSASNPTGTGWVKVDGLVAAQVSVSDLDGKVWAVDRSGTVHRRTGVSSELPSGASWEAVPGIVARYVDVGGAGVWATDTADNIYYRTDSREDCEGSGWQRVDGKLAQVASGGEAVWGVTQSGGIYYRLGVTATRPIGSEWLQIPGGLKQLSVSTDNNALWGVNANNEIYSRFQ